MTRAIVCGKSPSCQGQLSFFLIITFVLAPLIGS